MQPRTEIAATYQTTRRFIQKVWPPATIACGLALTATWVSLLGYGAVTFILRAI